METTDYFKTRVREMPEIEIIGNPVMCCLGQFCDTVLIPGLFYRERHRSLATTHATPRRGKHLQRLRRKTLQR